MALLLVFGISISHNSLSSDEPEINIKIACRMNCTRIRVLYYSTHHLKQRFPIQRHTSSKVEDALQLFDEMLQRQPPPSIIKFNQLIAVIVKMKHYSTALSLFNKINLMNIPIDIYTMNISINCHCQLHQVNYGFSLLATIFKQGHLPDSTTYNTLINGLVVSDRVFEAVELFKKLIRDQLCEPDQFTFATVINGLCKVGYTSKAFELLNFIEESSYKPCVEQYNTVIDSLCKDRMVDDALQLFSKMTEKGVIADVITYNSLIHGLCKFNRETEATKMLRDMEVKGVSPTVKTFNILVDNFCKKGSVKDAELAIQAMVRRGLHPNVITYNALIDGYCLRGELHEAEKVVIRMVESDLAPDIITYNSLINGYCKKKQIDKAMNAFQEIQNKGLIPDVITYSSLIQGLFQSGNPVEARELFNMMQAKGQTPDICTYYILFHGMCENGQFSDALVLFRSLGNKDLMMKDTGLYNILIDGCSKCGKNNLAMDLFDELLLKELKPDVRTYTMMIRVYCQEGLVVKGKELVRKMEENGCLPNSVTYNVIVQELLKKNECEEATNFLEEMINRGFKPEAATFEHLLPRTPNVGKDSTLRNIVQKLTCREDISNLGRCNFV